MQPMKAQPADSVPTGTNMLMEPKYDGRRVFAVKRNGEVTLFTAASENVIGTVPYINAALAEIPDGTILDGEICDLLADPSRQWNKAQSICSRDAVHVPYSEGPDDHPLVFCVFDLLELVGTVVTKKSLDERKRLLNTLFGMAFGDTNTDDVVTLAPELPCTTETLDQLLDEGWEGVVCKSRDSTYVRARTHAWLKIKGVADIEATCTGFFTATPGSQFDGKAVGGIEFRIEYPDGKVFDGRCGTGMKVKEREEWYADPNTYIGRVVDLRHWGILPTGALRFPSFSRFRDPDDKPVAEVQEPMHVEAPPIPASANGVAVIEEVKLAVHDMPAKQIKTMLPNPTEMNEILLERVDTLEGELDSYKARCEDLEMRLDGTLSAIGGDAHAATAPASPSGVRKSRRYGAMGRAKLEACIEELERGSGEAVRDCIEHGRDVGRDLQAARQAARGKGWAR